MIIDTAGQSGILNDTKGAFVCVAPVGDQCGEAATWVPEELALYWTDVNRFLVHRLDTSTDAVTTWLFDEPCVALFRTDVPGTLLLALGSRIIRWQPEDDRREEHRFRAGRLAICTPERWSSRTQR